MYIHVYTLMQISAVQSLNLDSRNGSLGETGPWLFRSTLTLGVGIIKYHKTRPYSHNFTHIRSIFLIPQKQKSCFCFSSSHIICIMSPRSSKRYTYLFGGWYLLSQQKIWKHVFPPCQHDLPGGCHLVPTCNFQIWRQYTTIQRRSIQCHPRFVQLIPVTIPWGLSESEVLHGTPQSQRITIASICWTHSFVTAHRNFRRTALLCSPLKMLITPLFPYIHSQTDDHIPPNRHRCLQRDKFWKYIRHRQHAVTAALFHAPAMKIHQSFPLVVDPSCNSNGSCMILVKILMMKYRVLNGFKCFTDTHQTNPYAPLINPYRLYRHLTQNFSHHKSLSPTRLLCRNY